MIDPSRLKRQERGFTLIEMIIVCAIISILLGVMVPIYRIHVLHANEAVLKEDLYNMRQAIDQYTQDKGKAPQAWMTLFQRAICTPSPKILLPMPPIHGKPCRKTCSPALTRRSRALAT